jgi:hypothetical protein
MVKGVFCLAPPRVGFRVTVVHVAGSWAVGVGSAVGSHGEGACPVLGVGVPGVGSHGEGAISVVGVVVGAWTVDGGTLGAGVGEGGAQTAATMGSVKRTLFVGFGGLVATSELGRR